jgi:uncharacterized Tic20 family protein
MSDVVSNEPQVTGISAEEKQWGMFAHLAGVAAILLGGMGFLGPLIVWLVKKDQMPFVNDQGKESLNYQINVLVLLAVLGPISVIMAFLTFGLILIPAGAAFVVLAIVMPIVAAMKANTGEAYRYPLIIRVIS